MVELTTNPVDFHARVAVAVEQAMAKMDPDAMAVSLIKEAHAQRREILLKLMGFSNTWGKWEVDRTNGRVTALTDTLHASLEPLAKKWIAEVLESEKAALEQAFKAAAKRYLKQSHSWALERVIKGCVEEAVNEVSKEFKDELLAQCRAQLGLVRNEKA